VRNKANLPVANTRRQWRAWHSCKTKPIGGPIAPNIANFGGSGRGRRAKCAKQSQTWEDWSMWARAAIGCGPAAKERDVRNKANSRTNRHGQGIACPSGPVVQTKPIWFPGGGGRPLPGLPLGPIAPNKANSLGGADRVGARSATTCRPDPDGAVRAGIGRSLTAPANQRIIGPVYWRSAAIAAVTVGVGARVCSLRLGIDGWSIRTHRASGREGRFPRHCRICA